MKFRLRILLLLAVGITDARSQSTISTLLGGAPDGVAAKSASLNVPYAIVSDKAGNIYISLYSAKQVVRIDSSGIIRLVAGNGTAGSAGDGGQARFAQLSQPVGLALDSLGALYIADSQTHRIRKVTPDGIISTFAGNGKSGSSGDGGPATEASLKQPNALAVDLSGNLLIADTGNHQIRIVRADGTISRFAGTGSRSSGGDDGPALDAGMDSPAGIAVDASNNILISDTGNHEIRMVSSDGIISLVAGKGVASYRGDGGDPLKAYFNTPTSLSFDSKGNLYILDLGNNRVRRITTGGIVNSYAGTGTRGSSGDGGLARSANISAQGIWVDKNDSLLIADGVNNRLRIVTAADGIIDTLAGIGLVSYNPRGIVVDGDNVYFSDTSNHRVRRFNLTTGQIDLIAGVGYASFSGDGSAAIAASLNSPHGLAFDFQKNLYIADTGNRRIRRVTLDGNIETIAGDGIAASTGDDGLATAAQLNDPYDVAVDGSGTFYVVERLGHRVRKATVGGNITTFAGTGTPGEPDSETGIALQQPLSFPQALAVEKQGSVLVADSGNNRIRRIGSDGSITTVAGTGNSDFAGDGGPALAASLRGPTGVSVDSTGNLYIADTANDAVRMVGADGIISTVAGTPGPDGRPGYTGDGSPATAYSLNRPAAVAPGPDCSLLVADTNNQRIRRVWPGVEYRIESDPPGLQITLDGQPAMTPAVISWLPGTHVVAAPDIQPGPLGTRYLSAGSSTVSVACGGPRGVLSQKFKTQYSLTVNSGDGGTVSVASPWYDSGASVQLTASPKAGFVFAGWDGDCVGVAACILTMNGPKTVTARFGPSQ